jgi:DNA primase
MAGVELAERTPADRQRTALRRQVLDLMKLAVRYYEHVLWSTAAGEPGRAFLERRQVSEETARRFGLGYAPGAANLTAFLVRKGTPMAAAQSAGLVRGGQDYFQRRLLVPIRDERGQPLAFTGRTLLSDEPRKYVNTPESPVYVKGRVLFALDVARAGIDERKSAVLMEGQFDVIVAHQAGVANAIASSGTALTAEQVQLLKRYTDELVLWFDNDRAGAAAADKAVELAQAHGLRTRVARIEGDAGDPDEFLRAGGSWERTLDQAAHGWEFVIKQALGDLNVARPAELEVALGRLNTVLARISEPPLREEYRLQAARWLGVDERLLVYREPRRSPARRASEAVELEAEAARGFASRRTGKKALRSVDYLLQVLVLRPDAIGRIQAALDPEDLGDEDRSAYFRIVGSLEKGGVEALNRELPSFPAEEESRVRRAWAAPPPRDDDEVVDDLIRRIRDQARQRRRRVIIRDLAEAEGRGDEAAVAALERQWQSLAEQP